MRKAKSDVTHNTLNLKVDRVSDNNNKQKTQNEADRGT